MEPLGRLAICRFGRKKVRAMAYCFLYFPGQPRTGIRNA